jgi:hypothetical protein
MRSFEERFCVSEPGMLRRVSRDVRLFWFLAGMMWRNLTLGGRVRRRYRAAMVKREPIYVDEALATMMPPPKPTPAPTGDQR